MNHSKSEPSTIMNAGGGGGGTASGGGSSSVKSTGGTLRELWSSVAHQVESHLHSSSSSSLSSASLTPSGGRHHHVGRRASRIRSWIGHDRDKEDDRSDGGDNSLHFTDTSDDEFRVADDSSSLDKDKKKKQRKDDSKNKDQKQNQKQKQHRNGDPHEIPSQTQTTVHTIQNNDVKMHMLPDEIREEEAVDMLTGLMGDGFEREVARRILRKYDGNVDKAAGALLEGERGEELIGPTTQGNAGSTSSWPAQTQTQTPSSQAPQTRLDAPQALAARPNTPVIDLTLDDDPDLQRAMQESMNTLHSGSQSQMQVYAPSPGQGQNQNQNQVQPQSQPERPVFGPSERPSDPNWAVVPSHQNESNDANFLQNLNRAIEASLETMGDSDALEPFPVEQQLRRDGCPVVLRPSMHTVVYAASILQGLFYVPQVRQRMASWRPPMQRNEEEIELPMSGPDFTLWALSEIFTHMDLARLCDLNVDKRLPAFSIEPWDRPAQPPGELSRKFFARLSATLEKAFIEQFAHGGQPLPKPRLLHFQYGSGTSEPGELLQETSIVPIDVNGGESNDLIGRLSAQLSKPQSEPGKQSVILEPSEVVAFELVRSNPGATASGSGLDRKAFTYPKTIYLDQFLKENVELAQMKHQQRREMLEEVQQLVKHKMALTNFDGKDTLKDLRSAIFYFENVADAKGDSEREVSIQATTRKLKGILTTIEEGIKASEKKIDTLRTHVETLLDCEELQNFKYELRVVFVHDGLYGRKHLYSYVHDMCCWWKIADSLIEKVPEEVVFNDQAGLHLSAGPYLLFYSRATDVPVSVLPWMDDIKDDVKAANREFLSQLPPELVGDIMIDEEAVSSLGGGSAVVKNRGAGDGMDVS